MKLVSYLNQIRVIKMIANVRDWIEKARDENDSFDRYISYFIAFNILYNLNAKKVIPNFDPIKSKNRDSELATKTIIELISDNATFVEKVAPELFPYIRLIPVEEREFWGKIDIAKALKATFGKKDYETILNLFRWLYKVRCNVFHGGKSYDINRWKVLLDQSSYLLDEILELLIRYYEIKYP